jgi:DNA-binding NarL/FixJ family response regulator
VNGQQDLQVCGEAASAEAAFDVIAETRPDVAIVDLSLRSGNGLDLIKRLSVAHPRVRTLVLSMHDEIVYAERALHAGARGYVMKEMAPREVLTAIRDVAHGGRYVSARVSARHPDRVSSQTLDVSSPVARLTDRERQVFELIGSGLATSRIARELKLSVKTVETHQAHIKEKLGLRNASELIRSATMWTHSL